MTRLKLAALILAGLATLWAAAPSRAVQPAAFETAILCVLGGDLAETATVSAAERPLLGKTCSGHKNRLGIPCQSERCLPPDTGALVGFAPAKGLPLLRFESDVPELFVPDGHFRPPRRSH